MKKAKVTWWMSRAVMFGSGAMLLQTPAGCALDDAMVNDLTNLVVQTLVSSLLTGGVPIL